MFKNASKLKGDFFIAFLEFTFAIRMEEKQYRAQQQLTCNNNAVTVHG